ncbi:MAG: prolipoprotein diacylglyceryl transferase family protein, partial [Flavobacteriaceae bacterium]
GAFFVLLFGVRFIAEFVKESQGGFETSLGILSTGQWLSIPLILIGLFLIRRAQSKIRSV